MKRVPINKLKRKVDKIDKIYTFTIAGPHMDIECD